jgi:predicted HicB family RNase H-like nuclease
MKSKPFAFVMSPQLKKKVQASAMKRGISMSEFIKDVLKEYYARNVE